MVPASSGVITYLPTHGGAASFYDDFHNAGQVALIDNILPITVGYLTMTSQDFSPSPTLSGIVSDLGTAGSSLIAADSLPFSVGAGVLNLHAGTDLDLVGSGSNSISLNQPISVTNLVLEEFGPITQTQPLSVTNLSLLGPNTYSLTDSANLISVLATGPARGGLSVPTVIASPLDNVIPLSINFGNLDVFSASNLLLGTTTAASGVSSLGTVTIQTSQGLTIAPGIQVVGHNYLTAPIPLILAAGTTFTNNAGSAALQADGEGRWQVWSQNPANDNRGGESYAFKQYNAVYGTTTPDQSTGNAFFYTLAPVLTASIGPVTKQYDSTTSATGIGSYSLSGAVDGDTVSLLSTSSTGSFADKNVGINKPITVTGLTVTPASNGAASVYGYSFNSTLVADVGTITAAPLTAYTSAASKVYDGSTLASGTLGSLSGVFSGDVVSLQGPAAFNFATKNVGTEIMVTTSGLSLMGADAQNYTFTPQTTTANITAAPLLYEAAATTRLYGSNNPAFTGIVSGLVGGDTLVSVASGSATFSSSATSASNIGGYAINGSGLTLTGGNYTLGQAEGNVSALTITPAPLIYTSSTASRTYGSANPVLTGAVTGLVLDQTLASVTTGAAAFTSAASPSSNVGSYAINGSGLTLTSGNYTLEQAEGNASALTIMPAPLTYASSATTRTYGSPNPAFTGTVTGLLLDQTLASVATGSAGFTSAATSTSNVGNYAIDGSGLTLTTGNYTLTQAAGNSSALTITPALLTYTGASASRSYGSVNPVFTGALTGFVNGDTLLSATLGTAVFSSPATASSNVGTYAINGSGLTANYGNYTFTQAAGNSSAMSVYPALLNYTANSGSRIYGALNPVFTGGVTGLVLGQTLASVASGALSFTSPATAATNVGIYAIIGSGLALTSANYILEQAAGNSSALTITPATLTYLATSGITRTYGSSNPAFNGTVIGFVNGQTIASATTGSLLFSSPATIASAPGGYAINGSGLTANFGNYIFTQAAGNATALTITSASTPSPTTLTIAINPSTELTGQTPGFTAAYTGPVVNGINIPSLLAGLIYQIAPSLNGPGIYAVTATGAAPEGYTLNIVPGVLNVVAGSPIVLPSQVPILPPALPVVLPVPPSLAGNFLQPLNSLGLFQVDVISVGIDIPSPFSFSNPGDQPPPFAQSLFFSSTNDKKDTYAAGAKP